MRIRIVFKKTEPMRYTSHLDLHRAWGRTVRRAGLPLLYSQGYHPQPKINLACALPLGITSEHELVDIWLENQIELSSIQEQLTNAFPPGIEMISVSEINDNHPTLQSTLISAVYEVTINDEIEDLEMRVNAVKNAKELIRERRGKKYDLKPLIEKISVIQDQKKNCQGIYMQLTAREGATGRPDEVIDACSIDPALAQIHRVKLVFSDHDLPIISTQSHPEI
jgi:radical SAM-linked protein